MLQRLIPLVVALLVIAGIVLLVVGLTQPSGTPRLQLDREAIDFGDQHFNVTVRAAFKLTNTGDAPLNLTVPKLPTVKEGC